jgi:HEPN domain-containing protein
MSEHDKEHSSLWIQKARNDLISAKLILNQPEGPSDTACFHAQQAIEKLLKAILTFHGINYPKTHDLVRLLDIVLPFFRQLEEFREKFDAMTDYAVEIRYPMNAFTPTREEAENALDIATKVMGIIERYIASDEL